MARLIWSETARADVRSIRQFVARDSQQAAARLAADITASVRRLRHFPESGRVDPEFDDPAYREIIVGRYRVIYRYNPDRDLVQIMIVVHGSRLLLPLTSEK